MKRITEVTRRDLFDIIQEGFDKEVDSLEYEPLYDRMMPSSKTVHISMPYCGRFSEIDFLDRLYHLDEMPSTDRRFSNAKGDIYCHTVSFNDWPEYWFLDDDRFELKDGFDDEPLLKFLCEMLHPSVREEDSPWKEYLDKFNDLLRQDGYELYSSYRISGRDVYKAREYRQETTSILPGNLFSERYKELICYGNGEAIDNISGNVSYNAKKHLCKVMNEFAEPMRIQRNRYDSWTDTFVWQSFLPVRLRIGLQEYLPHSSLMLSNTNMKNYQAAKRALSRWQSMILYERTICHFAYLTAVL